MTALSKTITNRCPIYQIDKSYAENVVEGPCFEGPLPKRDFLPEDQWSTFLGYKVASPLGVPAGPLLTAQWIELASNLGFDILTYKTIRSHAFASHPLPNILFVKESSSNPLIVKALEKSPSDHETISITNSFGMPSMPLEFLMEDLKTAKKVLKKGQILIVSITGSQNSHMDAASDFAKTALIAKDCGADIIEANFSCPNVLQKEGMLFCDPESSFLIANKLSKAIHPLPLIIKVGKYAHSELMRKSFIALARAGVRAIAGINTLAARVLKDDGKPALGKSREVSGICGDLIREDALEFIKDAYEIIRQEQLPLKIAGCGGIMRHQDFDAFLSAGANVALTATGMMWNPLLAHQWHLSKLFKKDS